MTNGCGGQGGFKFEILKKRIEKLPLIDENKVDSLYKSIEVRCCNPHDEEYDNGGGVIEFILANYRFCLNLLGVLHWTTTRGRLFIFIPVFLLLNIFGFKYFNWKKL